jgi:hypothetical protein
MASRKSIGERHHQALADVATILARHDQQLEERLAKANHGPDHGIPSPTRRVPETLAYHAECIASLARIIDQQLTPKKRGRPRKAA